MPIPFSTIFLAASMPSSSRTTLGRSPPRRKNPVIRIQSLLPLSKRISGSRAVGKRVRRRRDQQDLVPSQPRGVHRGMGEPARQSDLGLLIEHHAEHVARVSRPDGDPGRGVLCPEPFNDLRQQVRAHRERRGDGHHPALAGLGRLERLPSLLHGLEQAFRDREEHAPGSRQPDASPCSFEEPLPERGFEDLYARAHRWLREEQRGRGLSEAAVGRDRHERLDLGDVDHAADSPNRKVLWHE